MMQVVIEQAHVISQLDNDRTKLIALVQELQEKVRQLEGEAAAAGEESGAE